VQGTDLSAVPEAIGFAAPVKLATGKASGPGDESQKIAKRIEPAKLERALIAKNASAYDHALQHSI